MATSPPERGADDPGQRSQAGGVQTLASRWKSAAPHQRQRRRCRTDRDRGHLDSGGIGLLGTLNDKGIVIRRTHPTGSPSRDDHRVGDNPSTSSGESVAGWPTSTVRSGDTPRVTTADGSGYESDKAEVHLPRPLSRVCRGYSGLVRRLSAGTQPPTRAGEHDLGSTANNV